jgi:hypothetical protein
LLSLATLIAFLSAVLFVAHEVYRALTDSFIAPIILSPDNEVVLQAKLKAGDLYTERAKALAQRDALAGEIIAGAEAIDRLRALVPLAADGVGETLERERLLLEHMVRQQQGFVGQASANLAAQLITETDLARETQALAQVRVALLENGRALAESRLSREERLTRVELEVTRLETELRSKRAERDLLAEKLAMLDELEAQLRDRPVYQAMSRSLEVAFVPYTQIDDVAEGNAVYDCLWGLLFCEPVGSLGEFVPGEVVLTDPWGNPARGQYAVLELSEREAARSKSLRVRPSELPITARHMASR